MHREAGHQVDLASPNGGEVMITNFYDHGKIVALICHGSALLLWTRLSSGKLLAEGKKWTGFTDEEEGELSWPDNRVQMTAIEDVRLSISYYSLEHR
jgi:putative intracellular protease/amidase